MGTSGRQNVNQARHVFVSGRREHAAELVAADPYVGTWADDVRARAELTAGRKSMDGDMIPDPSRAEPCHG